MSSKRPFRVIVGVIGEHKASSENYLRGLELGRKLAELQALVVTGGLGGVMEAASRGAKEKGGLTVGILPGTEPTEANPYVDIPIATGLSEARNFVIACAAEVLIAIGGEFGTLSEIAFALKMGKPVISLDSWNPQKDGLNLQNYYFSSSVEETLKILRSLFDL